MEAQVSRSQVLAWVVNIKEVRSVLRGEDMKRFIGEKFEGDLELNGEPVQ